MGDLIYCNCGYWGEHQWWCNTQSPALEAPFAKVESKPDDVLALECALLDVRNELEAARRKFPGNANRLAALMEEVGELAQALLQGKAPGEVYTEAIQAAAMVVRLALEGDAQFGYRWNRGCTEDFTRTEG